MPDFKETVFILRYWCLLFQVVPLIRCQLQLHMQNKRWSGEALWAFLSSHHLSFSSLPLCSAGRRRGQACALSWRGCLNLREKALIWEPAHDEVWNQVFGAAVCRGPVLRRMKVETNAGDRRQIDRRSLSLFDLRAILCKNTPRSFAAPLSPPLPPLSLKECSEPVD